MKPFPDKRYNLIYADPPWRYKDSRILASVGAAASAYSTMPLDDLIRLPIQQICAEDTTLAMWATWPKLPEAMNLMQQWGFTYLTCVFVWIKRYRDGTLYSGLGHYTKSGSEFCLLGRKGNPLHRLRHDIRQIIETAPLEIDHIVEGHSKKPDIARELLVSLFGDIPKIELFARQTTPGWDVWGDEIA